MKTSTTIPLQLTIHYSLTQYIHRKKDSICRKEFNLSTWLLRVKQAVVEEVGYMAMPPQITGVNLPILTDGLHRAGGQYRR